MGLVKPGDFVCIKNPERNSLVKAGRLHLKTPHEISVQVPEGISKQDIKLLDSLVEWGILEIREQPILHTKEIDPLDEGLFKEYDSMNARDSVKFISSLGDSRRSKFLDYERGNKKRKTVLKVFD